MKLFFLSLIPMALFCVGVFALAKNVQFKPWTKTGQEEEYKEFRRIIAIPTANVNSAELPVVECPAREFDFGIMPPFSDGAHVFTINNVGAAPLVLKNAGTSCSCTETSLTAVVLEPGEGHAIEVTWNTDKAGKFAQFIKVTTNCPQTPELQFWVTGAVCTILDSSVGAFGFEGLLADEIRCQDFYLFSGVWDQVQINRIETTSADISCEQIESPQIVAEIQPILSQPQRPTLIKSRVDLRVSAKSQATGGSRTEYVRIYVQPPLELPVTTVDAPSDSSLPSPLSLAGMYKSTQADGTLLIELPVVTQVVRRFSLYSPVIADADKKLIDLGKLRTKSAAREWLLIAKVRGDILPTEVNVKLMGMEGVSATISKVESTSAKVGTSYRIKIQAKEKLGVAVYSGATAGKLRIETPGLPDEELLEFNVELDVLEEN